LTSRASKTFGSGSKDLDERVAAAIGRRDPFAEGQLLEAKQQLLVEGAPDRCRDTDIDRQPQQIGPVEVVDELEGIGHRRRATRRIRTE
jgi:hypothetical protein